MKEPLKADLRYYAVIQFDAIRRKSPMFTEPEVSAAEGESADEKGERSTMRVIGWFSVGMVVAAVGIYLGNELRSRYKFNNRTPYDFYTNSGEQQIGEFGVGV
jgi:hypothetical protein